MSPSHTQTRPILTPMTVRPLIPLGLFHLPVAAEIHRLCFSEAWDEAALVQLLAMPGSFGRMSGEENPCGFILARVAADEAEILTLAVLPQARRSGQGGRLLDAAAAEAAQQGATALFLEVASDNLAALGLYQSRHFATVGRRPHYYGLNHHATVLRREL